LAPNDRLLFVNSPWDWRHWRDSFTRNPSAEFTSAFFGVLALEVNRWTQGCKIALEWIESSFLTTKSEAAERCSCNWDNSRSLRCSCERVPRHEGARSELT
jgi:hypothetical protein